MKLEICGRLMACLLEALCGGSLRLKVRVGVVAVVVVVVVALVLTALSWYALVIKGHSFHLLALSHPGSWHFNI